MQRKLLGAFTKLVLLIDKYMNFQTMPLSFSQIAADGAKILKFRFLNCNKNPLTIEPDKNRRYQGVIVLFFFTASHCSP